MLNYAESFENALSGGEEFASVYTDAKFMMTSSQANVKVDGNVITIYDDSCTIVFNNEITVNGNLDNDCAVVGLALVLIYKEIYNNPNFSSLVDFINKGTKYGVSPFAIYHRWNTIYEDGMASKMLHLHRNLVAGGIVLPDNWNELERLREGKKVTSNPEKLERRTRIW